MGVRMIQSVGPILISGPRAADLAFRAMTFSEELSQPFTYSVEVLSEKPKPFWARR
jgi:uncharacterized protein involved in type VI secretion and phage assembly